jgi:hypothetical protein
MSDRPEKANGAKRPRFHNANGVKQALPRQYADRDEDDVNVSIVNVHGSGPTPIHLRQNEESDTD